MGDFSRKKLPKCFCEIQIIGKSPIETKTGTKLLKKKKSIKINCLTENISHTKNVTLLTKSLRKIVKKKNLVVAFIDYLANDIGKENFFKEKKNFNINTEHFG